MWRVWRISVPFFFQSTIHRNKYGSPFPRDFAQNWAGLVIHAERRESSDLRLRAVSRFELIGGVHHMVPQTLARGYQGVETLYPALKLIVVIWTTHPDPVPFKLGAQGLQLWEHLGLERIVPVFARRSSDCSCTTTGRERSSTAKPFYTTTPIAVNRGTDEHLYHLEPWFVSTTCIPAAYGDLYTYQPPHQHVRCATEAQSFTKKAGRAE